ncbi:hypothetical protein EDB83DRAFT_2314332 [Lactarius deliciosus]|nr:hypothetical protein EDB83DRAFT_2314332 [Lactarius deliciosus]
MDVDVDGRGGGGGVGLVMGSRRSSAVCTVAVVIAAAAITPWSSSLPPPSLLGVVLTIVVVILAVTVVVILAVVAIGVVLKPLLPVVRLHTHAPGLGHAVGDSASKILHGLSSAETSDRCTGAPRGAQPEGVCVACGSGKSWEVTCREERVGGGGRVQRVHSGSTQGPGERAECRAGMTKGMTTRKRRSHGVRVIGHRDGAQTLAQTTVRTALQSKSGLGGGLEICHRLGREILTPLVA